MAKDNGIKKSWIVCDMDGDPLRDDDTGEVRDFNSEVAAIKAAKAHIKDGGNDEAWVYTLTHVVARPEAEPTVDVVR